MEDEDRTFDKLKQIPYKEMSSIAFSSRKNPFSLEWKKEMENIFLANGWTSGEFAVKFINEVNNYDGRTKDI